MPVQQQFYPVPTIDVPTASLFDAFYARPDIAQLYAKMGSKKPDGNYYINPGTGQINNNSDIPAIMQDWWRNVAGINDAPALYGNSMAVWAHEVLGYNVQLPAGYHGSTQGGATVNPGQPGTGQTTQTDNQQGLVLAFPNLRSAGGQITTEQFVWFGGFLMLVFWVSGFRRDEQLRYVPSPMYGKGIRFNPKKRHHYRPYKQHKKFLGIL